MEVGHAFLPCINTSSFFLAKPILSRSFGRNPLFFCQRNIRAIYTTPHDGLAS